MDELELAEGCARGDAAAVEAFERDYLSIIPSALAGMRLAPAMIDDVRALTRERLLPRLVAYAGKGKLRGLVQVTATRIAIDLVRRDGKLAALPAQLAAPGDLELSLIKAQYRAQFVDALRAAMAQLAARDRNLLHLHFLGGVTLERLATMYDVNRATIVRWLAAARAAVLDATRKAMNVPKDEVEEIFALVASRVSLGSLLHVSLTNADT